MGAKDTISKILKGAGNWKFSQSVAEDASNIAEGVGKLGDKAKDTTKKVKDTVNKADSKFFKDVKESEMYDSLMYQFMDNPRRLKTRYGATVVAGMAGVSVVNMSINSRHQSSLGQIETGGLSHMTSQITSPLTNSLAKGKYNPSNIMHGDYITARRENNVDGDIVFALHNMR